MNLNYRLDLSWPGLGWAELGYSALEVTKLTGLESETSLQ